MGFKRRRPNQIPDDEWENGPPPKAEDRPSCANCGKRLTVTCFGTHEYVDDGHNSTAPKDTPTWYWNGYEQVDGVPLFCTLRCGVEFAGACLRKGLVGSKYRKVKAKKKAKK